jgi:hypothetical protein
MPDVGDKAGVISTFPLWDDGRESMRVMGVESHMNLSLSLSLNMSLSLS